MAKEDYFFDKAFGVLKDNTGLTEQQKDTMLSNILLECCKQETTGIGRLKELVITYPWRFAFTLSTVHVDHVRGYFPFGRLSDGMDRGIGRGDQ